MTEETKTNKSKKIYRTKTKTKRKQNETKDRRKQNKQRNKFGSIKDFLLGSQRHYVVL